ncbi:hypothetical protein K440DRAFT_141560 [Wilcoxina mikolae CBS 423.85]|nr:hypothetical protein K440DRAFT_141560 [Wilcoxina mikolae CBS 423.85]
MAQVVPPVARSNLKTQPQNHLPQAQAQHLATPPTPTSIPLARTPRCPTQTKTLTHTRTPPTRTLIPLTKNPPRSPTRSPSASALRRHRSRSVMLKIQRIMGYGVLLASILSV